MGFLTLGGNHLSGNYNFFMMKKVINILLASLVLVFVSCSETIDKPKNLVSKNTMAEVVADLALGDQMSYLNETGSMEQNTIFIFKKHKISSKDFMESYKYYLSKPNEMESIYADAQDIVATKDPEAKAYIEKKLNQTTEQPTMAR